MYLSIDSTANTGRAAPRPVRCGLRLNSNVRPYRRAAVNASSSPTIVDTGAVLHRARLDPIIMNARIGGPIATADTEAAW